MVKLGETVGNAKNQWLLLDKREREKNKPEASIYRSKH